MTAPPAETALFCGRVLGDDLPAEAAWSTFRESLANIVHLFHGDKLTAEDETMLRAILDPCLDPCFAYPTAAAVASLRRLR